MSKFNYFGLDFYTISFILILVLGFILRIYNLSTNPPELYHDELINYVSAKKIVETGTDLEGKLLPYFSDRVEFRPPIMGFSQYISTRLLGEGVLGIRFPAVVFGLAAIIVLFYLVLELTKNRIAALSSSFVMAIIPWHIHYSRVGWEPAPVLFFLLSGLLLAIKGVNYKKPFLIYCSFAVFGLSIYTYHGSPLFSFLFLSAIFISQKTYFSQNKKIIPISLGIYLLFFLPFISMVLNQPSFFDRSRRIFTFANGVNKDSMYIFFRNYLSHFSLDFLFFTGDPNLRHGAQTGVLYFWMLPFIFFGLYYILFVNKKNYFRVLILLWLAIFPLGASLTNDGVPHAHRTLIGAPLFCILTGVGVWYFFSKIFQIFRSKILIIIILIMISLFICGYSLFKFCDKYFNEYPRLSQHWWYFGHKEIFDEIKILEKEYERVCLGHLNYWEAKPIIAYYLKESNLVAIEGIEDQECNKPNTIITTNKPPVFLSNYRLEKTIYDLDQKPKYYIFVK